MTATTVATAIIIACQTWAKLGDPIPNGATVAMKYLGGFDLTDGTTEVCFSVFDRDCEDCNGKAITLRWARVIVWQNGQGVASATVAAWAARKMWAACRKVASDSGRNEL